MCIHGHGTLHIAHQSGQQMGPISGEEWVRKEGMGEVWLYLNSLSSSTGSGGLVLVDHLAGIRSRTSVMG